MQRKRTLSSHAELKKTFRKMGLSGIAPKKIPTLKNALKKMLKAK
jgi:hypothetical protein